MEKPIKKPKKKKEREITLIPVESSNIHSVGYNSTKKKAKVKFKSGQVYEILDVTPPVWSEFMASESKGKAYNQLFKGKYTINLVN